MSKAYNPDPACNGTGMIDNMVCTACGGTGRLPMRQTCPDCNGLGIVDIGEGFSVCMTCYSAGVIPFEGIRAFILKALFECKDRTNDLEDKLDDVLDKCNDILQAIQNP
jgi:hypothetical protein